MDKHKVVFTGGGTGGHVFPLVSVIRSLKKTFPKEERLEMFYIAPEDDIPSFDFTQEGLKVNYIFAGKLRRHLDPVAILKNVLDIFKIPLGILQALYYLTVISPDIVISKGGYGSVPTTVAAKIIGIPIILHESDIAPGLSNKLISKFATEVFVNFHNTEGINPGKKFVVGNPIRKEIMNGEADRAVERFNLTEEKPVLLILGGSQGSRRINNTVLAVITDLLKDFEVLHQCGSNNFEQIKKETDAFLPEELEDYYHPYSFFDEDQLKDAYEIADLVVSRAGAGSLAEIIANKKPSILIPLPEAAQDHQTKNAYRVAEVGASIVMEEENLTPHLLLEKIKHLFSPGKKLKEMQKATKDFAKPRAGEVLAAYIKEYLLQ